MKVTLNFLIAILAMISIPTLGICAHIFWSVPLSELSTAMFIGAGGVAYIYTLFKAHGG